MDRGVKVAIFVASIASLGLGLIWDQVLSHARVAVEESSTDELSAEVIAARIGSPDIDRLDLPEGMPALPIKNIDEGDPESSIDESDPVPADTSTKLWTEYTVQNGDSWWKIAHVRFKDRGLSSKDVQNANPDVKLVAGRKILVPTTPGSGAAPAPKVVESTSTGTEVTEYTVQDGDSWWKIAHVRFKDRNISSDDLIKANEGVKLVAGVVIKIPAAK